MIDNEFWVAVSEDSNRLLLYRVRIELQQDGGTRIEGNLLAAMKSAASVRSLARVLLAGGYPYWVSSAPQQLQRGFVDIAISEPPVGQPIEPIEPDWLFEREAEFLQADLQLTTTTLEQIFAASDYEDAYHRLLGVGLSATQAIYVLSEKGLEVLTAAGRQNCIERLSQVNSQRSCSKERWSHQQGST